MAKVLRIRFFEKVSEPDENGCRRWLGSFVTRGYGAFWLDGRVQLAHRVAFFLAYGRWPEPMCLHRCDNRWCCEESHLFEGESTDNVRDMVGKGRHDPSRGERNGMAKLTDAAVRDIRTRARTQREYAALYGVSQGTVWLAQAGRKWRHVIP